MILSGIFIFSQEDSGYLILEYDILFQDGRQHKLEVVLSEKMTYELTHTGMIERGYMIDLGFDRYYTIMTAKGRRNVFQKGLAKDRLGFIAKDPADYTITEQSETIDLLGYNFVRYEIATTGGEQIIAYTNCDFNDVKIDLNLRYTQLPGLPGKIITDKSVQTLVSIQKVSTLPEDLLDGKMWTREQMDNLSLSTTGMTFDELERENRRRFKGQ